MDEWKSVHEKQKAISDGNCSIVAPTSSAARAIFVRDVQVVPVSMSRMVTRAIASQVSALPRTRLNAARLRHRGRG